MPSNERPVIVLGAGPSGLAVGACLAKRGVPFEIIEQSDRVGSRWRTHYERLHLHTVKQFSALPGLKWPAHVPMYPSRDEVVAYLESYAERFALRPRFGETVKRVARGNDGDRWRVETDRDAYEARAVVVATGYNRVPFAPSWPGQERFAGTVAHASSYRNGRAWRGKRALVVGAGNTGAEIALDLWEHGARVDMSIRGAVHVVPRDALGLPAQINSMFLMGRLPVAWADRASLALLDRLVGDLRPWGIERPSVGPVTQVVRDKKIPLIDVGTIALVKQGHIAVRKGIARFDAAIVVFENGDAAEYDLVLLATGYRAALEAFLEDAGSFVDERGHPVDPGVRTSARGLYFVGYRNPLDGQLHDIAREAERVALFVHEDG